jgi:beta-galactosidase/beta-glucuronidase
LPIWDFVVDNCLKQNHVNSFGVTASIGKGQGMCIRVVIAACLVTLFVGHPGFAFSTSAEFDRQAARLSPPQPQFARQNWLSLDGGWSFSFDDQDHGVTEGWQNGEVPFPKTIRVPFTFETALSGVGDPSEHAISWYQRAFAVPSNWKSSDVLLHFGASYHTTAVWVNGVPVGKHVGGHTPFVFNITKALKPGNNRLTVRVSHPSRDLFLPRGKQAYQPESWGIYYSRNSGIWQSVWIENVGHNYLDAVDFSTGLDGQGSAFVQLHEPAEGLKLKVTIKEATGRYWNFSENVGSKKMPVNRQQVAFQIHQPRLWSPKTPSLYTATFELLDAHGARLDQVSSYFGIRDIKLSQGRMLINNKPTYLKLVLDQGYWREGGLSAPSEEALITDIRTTLALGFNGVRKHQKLEDPRFLYWADRMGLLVSSEFASPLDFSLTASQEFAAEWTEAVERDRNHPSIVMWVPANESWGYTDLGLPEQQNAMREMFRLTKKLDPSRPVIDNDGWEHTSETDLFALHDYAHTGEELRAHFAAFNPAAQPPIDIPNARPPLVPNAVYNGSPLYLSEFAGIGYVLPGDTVPPGAWGYSGLEVDGAHAAARLRDLYHGLQAMPNIMGFCFTQLSDVEQEVNGLMTYDRRPKYDYYEVKALNDALPN